MELGQKRERREGGFDVPFPSLGNDYRAETAFMAPWPFLLPGGEQPLSRGLVARQLELA